jgi:hypothetical protein
VSIKELLKSSAEDAEEVLIALLNEEYIYPIDFPNIRVAL